MTPRETMIEAMARAINYTANIKWNAYNIGKKQSFDISAAALDAFLATLPALGLRVVPVEADDALREVMNGHAAYTVNWDEYVAQYLAAAPNPMEARDD